MHRLVPFSDFGSASKELLAQLHERIGFSLWMVTRTEGDDWIVLHSLSQDPQYNVTPGTVLKWSDSYCSRMIRGEGPQFAPIAKNIGPYAQAPMNKNFAIGAYFGLPLLRKDGSLFGTLCAIDPAPQPESVRQEIPFVKTLVRFFTTVLSGELEKIEVQRRGERRKDSQLADALGILTFEDWEARLDLEEARVARYGSPTSIVCVQLNEVVDVRQLVSSAEILASVIRTTDALARGPDGRYLILAVETDEEASRSLYNRIVNAFAQAQIKASVGFAIRAANASLRDTWQAAENTMLAQSSRA